MPGSPQQRGIPIADRREIHSLAARGRTPEEIEASLGWPLRVVREVLAGDPERLVGAAHAGAAKRLGLTTEEYQRRRRDGLRWCSPGQHWTAEAEIVDAERARCRVHHNETNRSRHRRKAAEARGGER